VWTGDGAKHGNHALVARGATPVDDLAKLFDMDPALPAPLQSSLFCSVVGPADTAHQTSCQRRDARTT
jgi:hypothetical protein